MALEGVGRLAEDFPEAPAQGRHTDLVLQLGFAHVDARFGRVVRPLVAVDVGEKFCGDVVEDVAVEARDRALVVRVHWVSPLVTF